MRLRTTHHVLTQNIIVSGHVSPWFPREYYDASCYPMSRLLQDGLLHVTTTHNDAGTINKHILKSGFMRAKNTIEMKVSKKENECLVTL
jgi:hypothetical protein